ncbi:hypothetical protein JCGZ_21430 [Jatropha curcas]|uniref:DUF1771 domain-containing protein n=1 Tax=Jatropha curcas TaxID=180498 RepID=A0A067JN62_JATCU|nr:putative nuclear RNA export factor SDE5 isoform X2 [Jatropha curcas]XP_020541359.1 putative nuclear RNA export factor SDE5 isoform X2 [Jatropha curcas]XP_037492456.1 putative nuclear RNA export factor SDE5 isoform X2 [Jatropha curcas]KDP20959.1 hypothetical protein JCGZ_21430 [Jatropha curcas]
MESSLTNTKYEDNDESKLKDLAAEFLYDMQETTSMSSSVASIVEERGEESFKSFSGHISEKSCHINGKFKARKQKQRPVSGGTVSSIIGKDYIKSMPVANGTRMGTKPMKLDVKEFPMSELWVEETKLNPSKNDHMHNNIEGFFFRMLGDGFQLERDVIHQVLVSYGYDMQKSMEKLLDFSGTSLDEGNKCLDTFTAKIVNVHSNSEEPSFGKKLLPVGSQRGDGNEISYINEGGSAGQEERSDLQKEVLAALFDTADRSDGLSRKAARAARRPRVLGELVVESPRDFTLECKADSICSKQENDKDEEEEDGYQQLRIAVKEYRVTMKEYYKAAVDAFAKGDHDQANKLIDKGHFFHEKARKADEESSQKIFETKNADRQDEVTLDLHDHGAKEAMRLLKFHLSSLSGISSIKYLKVILETNEEDTSKGARRRLVMKLLEKESIKWTEGQNSGTILIRLDNINRKCLSFAKR